MAQRPHGGGLTFAGTAIGGLHGLLLTSTAISALQRAEAPKQKAPQGGGITLKATVRSEDNPYHPLWPHRHLCPGDLPAA